MGLKPGIRPSELAQITVNSPEHLRMLKCLPKTSPRRTGGVAIPKSTNGPTGPVMINPRGSRIFLDDAQLKI